MEATAHVTPASSVLRSIDARLGMQRANRGLGRTVKHKARCGPAVCFELRGNKLGGAGAMEYRGIRRVRRSGVPESRRRHGIDKD